MLVEVLPRAEPGVNLLPDNNCTVDACCATTVGRLGDRLGGEAHQFTRSRLLVISV